MSKYVIGIDEVGRGSLAGPVVVAAVALPKDLEFRIQKLGGLRDSKKLTPVKREQWVAHIKASSKIRFAVARVNPRRIERINIANAANSAAERACRSLCKKYRIPFEQCQVLIDGGLYLGKARGMQNVRTIVRGDEKFTSIKLASIVAKVHRDNYMRRLGKKYPSYRFEIHKGYGTKVHMRALKKYGPSEVHRMSFIQGIVTG